jgi:hypothetical protein
MTKKRNLSFRWDSFNWPFLTFWVAYIGALVFGLGYVALI